MRYALLVIAVLPWLAGCKQELSKDAIELFAAIAFATYGMEEGNGKFSAERVDRRTLSDAVEYIVFSKADGPPGMTMTIKSPACYRRRKSAHRWRSSKLKTKGPSRAPGLSDGMRIESGGLPVSLSA